MSNFSTFGLVTGGIPGTAPQIFTCSTPDSLVTITAAGYLDDLGTKVKANDVFYINYLDTSTQPPGENSTLNEFYSIFSAGHMTLVSFETGLGTAAGKDASDNTQPTVASVVGATVTNDIIVAADTAGSVKTFAAGLNLARTFAVLQSGADANAGEFRIYPSTTNSGYVSFTAQNNSGNYHTVISQRPMGQAGSIYVTDPGNATANINCSLVNAALTPVGAWLPGITVSLTAAGLASSGHITIQVASGSMQFKVRNIMVANSGPGLSGGGGDRLIQITDGHTVYNNAGITAALAGTPINTVWGGTGNPLTGATSIDTPTFAGASLYAVYAGGTTDYTTGSFAIIVWLERTA